MRADQGPDRDRTGAFHRSLTRCALGSGIDATPQPYMRSGAADSDIGIFGDQRGHLLRRVMTVGALRIRLLPNN
jgi:hypothetical protein